MSVVYRNFHQVVRILECRSFSHFARHHSLFRKGNKFAYASNSVDHYLCNVKSYQMQDEINFSDQYFSSFEQEDPVAVELDKLNVEKDKLDRALHNELDKLSPEEKKEILNSVISKNQNQSEDFDYVMKEAIQYLDESNSSQYISRLREASTELLNNLHHIGEKRGFNLLLKKFRRLYFKMTGSELISLLSLYQRLMLRDGMHIKQLLQIIKIHLNDLNLKDLIILEFSLRKLESNLLVKNLQFSIPIVMEKFFTAENLVEVSLHDLLVLLGICIQNYSKKTYHVLNEISVRGIISSRFALSTLWNIFDLPPRHLTRLMIPDDTAEVVLETLTKECLAVMTRNIDDYSADYLSTTLTKAAASFDKGNDFVYQERFLEQVVTTAVQNKWNLLKMNGLIYSLLIMRFVSEDLLKCFIDALSENPKVLDGKKMFHVLSALSCLPTHSQKILDTVKQTFDSSLLGTHTSAKYFLIKKCLEMASIGVVSRPLYEAVFDESYIKRFFKANNNNEELDLFQILLLNCWLSRSTHSDMCLKPEMKEMVFDCYSAFSPKHSPLVSSVIRDIFPDNPSCLVSHVQYNKELFIDHLMVVDDEGVPVSLNAGLSVSSNYIAFEDLGVDDSLKRIAFITIPRAWIFKPGRKFYGLARFLMEILENSGFKVIPCLESLSSRDLQMEIRDELLKIGVKL